MSFPLFKTFFFLSKPLYFTVTIFQNKRITFEGRTTIVEKAFSLKKCYNFTGHFYLYRISIQNLVEIRIVNDKLMLKKYEKRLILIEIRALKYPCVLNLNQCCKYRTVNDNTSGCNYKYLKIVLNIKNRNSSKLKTKKVEIHQNMKMSTYRNLVATNFVKMQLLHDLVESETFRTYFQLRRHIFYKDIFNYDKIHENYDTNYQIPNENLIKFIFCNLIADIFEKILN